MDIYNKRSNQQCHLSNLGLYTGGEDGNFTSIADLMVTRSSSQGVCAKNHRGDYESRRREETAVWGGTTGCAHGAISLTSSQESALIGFVASPNEIKVFHGQKNHGWYSDKPCSYVQLKDNPHPVLLLYLCVYGCM